MDEQKKIYIGNLDYGVAEHHIAEVLEAKGIVAKDIAVIMDKFTGRSKGFAFAQFATEEDMQKAIEALDGQNLNGRTVKANKAQPQVRRDDSNRRGGRF